MVGPDGPAAPTRVANAARAETILNCILLQVSLLVILNTGNRLDEDNSAKIIVIFILPDI